jgi:hypothetical protein
MPLLATAGVSTPKLERNSMDLTQGSRLQIAANTLKMINALLLLDQDVCYTANMDVK